MANEQTDTQSSVHSYHCLCSTLILTTPYILDNLPVRQAPATDNAIILPINQRGSDDGSLNSPHAVSALQNVTTDRKQIVVRREDGFEKRTLLRCARCKLIVAYQLEESGQDTGNLVIYIPPGGLTSTANMKAGIMPQRPVWAEEAV